MEKTIAEELAAIAKRTTFDDLPKDVVHQVKRSVTDTLGIALGGFSSEPSRILQEFAKDMGGPAESTVFVTGHKTSCLYASLANGAMARYLDYMDRTFMTKEARINMGHHGESVVPVLAVAEREHVNGREMITAVALAYELLTKVSDSVGGNHGVLDRRGWAPENMRTPCAMALIAGRLLGSTEEQMAHGLAIAGAYNFELGILHSPEEQLTMARNLRFPYGAYTGITGALLARKGFQGPLNVFEGHHGIADTIAGNEMDLAKLRQPITDWSILNTWTKNFATEGRMHGHIEATLTLVKEHDVKPEDVAEVRIKTTDHVYRRMANPTTRRHPKTKYTADHSCYYNTAVAIMDRALGPEQFTDEMLHNPAVQALSDKVFVEPDPDLEAYISPAIVDITLTSGKHLHCKVLQPKGHPLNPMSDDDIEAKFRTLARPYMGDRQMADVIAAIQGLEGLDDVGALATLMTVPRHN